jgi:hypothetical protein
MKILCYFSVLYIYMCKNIKLEFTKSNSNAYSLSSFGRAEELRFYNDEYNQILVELCLGTPSQCFKVMIDTSSVLLWVGENRCKNCKSRNLFNLLSSNNAIFY